MFSKDTSIWYDFITFFLVKDSEFVVTPFLIKILEKIGCMCLIHSLVEYMQTFMMQPVLELGAQHKHFGHRSGVYTFDVDVKVEFCRSCNVFLRRG